MKKLIILTFLLLALMTTLSAVKLVSPFLDDGSYDPTRTYEDYSDYQNTRATINVAPGTNVIHTAVTNANANDIIQLSAGDYYSDGFTVDKPLTIQGTGSNTVIHFTGTTNGDGHLIYGNAGPQNYVNLNNMQLLVTEDINMQSGIGIYMYETSSIMDGIIIDFNEWLWLGIYAKDMNPEHDTQFTATNCSVTGILKNGITGNGAGLSVTMTGNTIYGPSLTNPEYTGNIAGNGLQIGRGATGILTNNIIYDFYSRDANYGSTGILGWCTTASNAVAGRTIEMSNNSIYDCELAIAPVEDFALTVTMNDNNIYWTELRIDPIDDDVYSPDGFQISRYYSESDDDFIANLINNNIVRYPVCDSMEVTGYAIGGGLAFGWGGSYLGDGPVTVDVESSTFSGINNAFEIRAATKLIEVIFDEVEFDLNDGYGVQIYSFASGLETINVGLNFTNSTFSCTNPDATLIQNWLELTDFNNIVLNNNDFSNFAGNIISNGATGIMNADYNYWGVNDPTTKVEGSVNVSPWYTDAAMTNLAHPAAQNVTVSKVENNVTLEWTAWDTLSTYEIYRTTGNPYEDGVHWVKDNVASIANTTTNYEVTGQSTGYAFYRVCLTGEEDYVENDVVGYYTVNCDINNDNTDLNFISVPFSTDYANASDYVQNVIGTANCNTISKWVDSAQAWQTATYVSELSMWFGDFAIEENGAYLMGCTTDNLSYVVTGYLPVMPEYTLVTGNNLIMVPMDVAANTDSGTFYDDEFDLEVGDTISNWSVSGQTWSTRTYGGSSWEGTQFNVNPGYPVMAGE